MQSASTSTINDEINQYANKMHKMIEINVDTESEIAIYDRYLSHLLDNDLNNHHHQQLEMLNASMTPTVNTVASSVAPPPPPPAQQQQQQHQKSNEIFDLEKTIDDECKWTCLLQYEEEERVNKLITTVTTRTITEDMLCYDNKNTHNRLCLNDSIGDELDDAIDSNNNHNNTNNATIATSNTSDAISIPIINETTSDGIYSNLVNYTSSPSPSTKHVTVATLTSVTATGENDDDDVSELIMFKNSSTSTTSSSSSSNYDSGCYSSAAAARSYKLLEYTTDEIFA